MPLPLIQTALAAALSVTVGARPVTTMPIVVPQPETMRLTGAALDLGDTATIAAPDGIDAETLHLVRAALDKVGVRRVVVTKRPARAGTTRVVLGLGSDPLVARALAQAGGAAPESPEGYALVSTTVGGGPLIVLAGQDADGLYYAAQSLRQIAARGTLPGLTLSDRPRMAVRGTIEGFYGAPWSMTDRMAHLAFLGGVKANTYVYSPKDDPFARDRWRDPYPRATFEALRALADQARRYHVRFTYAISPGPSVCYSDPADIAALERKFAAFRAIGVRSFYIAFDDIDYTKWNCERDRTTLGEPGAAAAGRAQAAFINTILTWLAARDGNAARLMIVPTEYSDTKETPYKAALRAIDPRVLVQWTGTDVVPPSVSIRDAKAAATAFGRKTVLWDNYPVNDYAETAGRLLLAPYIGREPQLAEQLNGILANPMNQEAPSRVAITGSAAFAWNDRDYDADRAWRAAAAELASRDGPTTEALLLLFDLEHLAPTFHSQPWQSQAPALKRLLDGVTDALADGSPADRTAMLAALGATAARMIAAPATIRAGVHDAGFLAQSAPWLDALGLWGEALQATAKGLIAANAAMPAACTRFAEAASYASRAEALRTIEGATRPQGAIRVGDGVLDRFIRAAPTLIAPLSRAQAPAGGSTNCGGAAVTAPNR
ncbi:beta-N-acetylglucosaminidase domain-containing protein [Sphingomonas sp. H39-1-10]|uniref:beta-N-acetylhexosaminidase family protein n=1 Tax=Sphingomonas pollutisoli TaxID=3030829 RepID=UPI0023BA2206|nr:beta-N-acetylglucosaminidase domain-containing protein [Sphingomonas pollutisoli]MDF0487891.1 beta-N-acetylglucosaminidase domain-containing protein [Sphingomonas pollutisoli]